METLTDITSAETKRRQNAGRYERLKNTKIQLDSSLQIITANIASATAQLKIFEDMDALANGVDPKIDCSGRIGLFRHSLIGMLATARDDQRQKLERNTKMKKDASARLASTIDELATFE